jgi:DNA-directed RNA polymerase alpha subunit
MNDETNPTPVESLGLKCRVTNFLRADGLWFVQQLCERSERDLRLLPGIGGKSVIEIKQALALRGLRLCNRVNREEWR